MAPALEPAFTPGRSIWPLAGMALANLEPDDPDLAIPPGALQRGVRESPERHFFADRDSQFTHTATEPLGPKRAKTPDLQRKWKLALVVSCIFHVAVAAFFLFAPEDTVLMEGVTSSGIALLGSPEDQVKAGEISEPEDTVDVTMVTMLDAVPVETVDAEPVPVDDAVEATDVAEAVAAEPEILKPVEETPVEQVREHTEPEPVENEPVPAPAVTETAPEVLATDRAELVDDDNLVQKPAEAQAAEPVDAAETAQAESAETSATARAEQSEAARAEPSEATKTEPLEASKVETAEVAKAEPTETKPIEPVEDVKPQPEVETKTKPAKPAKEAQKKPAEEKKPTAEKKTAKQKTEEKKKVAEKADAKPKKAGNGGQNQTNARRGQADGQEKGDSRQASRGGSKNGEIGNAAVSNYPGKVRSKLVRTARSVRAKGNGEVVVAFAVSSNGGVRSARVARSSGVASVDRAALQAVRKASPFPPIPAGAGRSTWEFSVPLAFRR